MKKNINNILIKLKNFKRKKENTYKNNNKNIFELFIDLITLKKNKNSSSIKENIKLNSYLSVISAILIISIMMISFNFLLSKKEVYSDYTFNINDNKTVTENTNSQEETNKQLEIIERISTTAIDEELDAQASFKGNSYSFNVDRIITTKEKIHLFKTANWADIGEILKEKSILKVNKLVSPGGFMMYQIAEGEYKNMFITANPKLVDAEINDDINTEFINKPVAIKILTNSNSFNNKELTSIKKLLYKNNTLNISGLGVYNNRLIYYISDGSFVPINPNKISETTRENSKEDKDSKEKSNNKTTNNKKDNKK